MKWRYFFLLLLVLAALWTAYDIGWHVGWTQRHQIEVLAMLRSGLTPVPADAEHEQATVEQEAPHR